MKKVQRILNFHTYKRLFCANFYVITLKSASNLNGNLNCSKELEHYAS